MLVLYQSALQCITKSQCGIAMSVALSILQKDKKNIRTTHIKSKYF